MDKLSFTDYFIQLWYTLITLLKVHTPSLWCGPPWKQHHTESYLPAIYTGWFLQNLSLQSSIFSLVPDLVSLLSDSCRNSALKRCFDRYFSPKCGHGVELCSLPWRNSMKPRSSFEGKTYLFAGSAIKLNNVEAWKMTKVGNKSTFRSR